jgi:hypothetical protein
MNESGESTSGSGGSLTRRCCDLARRRPKTAAVLLAVVGVGITVAFLGGDAGQPRFKGKTLDEWFYGEKGHPGMKATMDAAVDAFSEMGADCVPFLIEKLRERDTKVDGLWQAVHSKLPKFAREGLRKALDDESSFVQNAARRALAGIDDR